MKITSTRMLHSELAPAIRPARTGSGRLAKAAAFGLALAVSSPMVETALTSKTASAQTAAKYNPNADPVALDQKLKDITASLNGTQADMARAIFNKLHRGASGGVKVVKGEGRPPRTASQTLELGGDCTELATVVAAIMKAKDIGGGVKIVHFDSAPADVDHMIPYISGPDGDIIVDLQAGRLGATAQGRYKVVVESTLELASAMHHREWGDYFRDKGKGADAIKAYSRALQIFDGDAYVHQNLGILYEKAGKMDLAKKHFTRAASLDPKYKRDEKRGSYNEELQAGQAAAGKKDYAGCVRHIQAALDSGEKLKPGEKAAIEQFRDACKQRVK